MKPCQRAVARRIVMTAEARLQESNTRRRSKRSATDPATGESSRPVMTLESISPENWVTDFVCWKSQTPRAKVPSPVPRKETLWPMKSMMYIRKPYEAVRLAMSLSCRVGPVARRGPG
jgi:hypothetical protein